MIAGSIEIQLMASVARLQRDMDQARQIVSQTTTSMTRMALAVKDALAGMLGGFSLVAFGNQIVAAQRQFDKLNASLITATGSAAEAAKTFKALQGFASTTPYGVADATEAFVKLKNLGLDPSQAALRSYGNTAAAMGKGLNQMVEAVADAATGEFERLKEFGITSAQTGDRVSLTFKGVTTTIGKNSDEIQVYLKKIGDTDFAGSMALRAATLDGAISNLGDSWEAFLLQISQSGVGDAASAGITALANNLNLLAGTVATLGAAKLASIFSAWVAKTYEEIAASAAARAATLANIEANAAEAASKVSQTAATQAMVVIAREEAVAKLASSNANIAAARAAIAAAEAAGAQSFALRTVRLATAELTVAEAQRSAMLAELALLGRQQASVSAQMTAALAAQTAAQSALNGASAAGAATAGLASRAIGLLGGPVGAIVTVLGLAATAWAVWGNSAKEANEKIAQSMDETAPQMLARLDDEIKKLKERKALLDAKPEVKNADEKDQAGIARLKADLEAIKANAGEYGGQTAEMRDMLIRIVTRQYNEAIADVEGKQKLQRGIAIAGDTTMAAVRQRLTGVNQEYLDTLEKLSAAHEKGIIQDGEYQAAVSKLAKDTFEGSAAGKLYSQSLDMQSSAVQRAAEAQGLLNQRQVEHIQFLKATGQIDSETAINSTAAAQIQSLNDQIKAQEKLRGIAAMRQGSEKEQADIAGRIAGLSIQIDNAKAKRKEDIFALEQQQYREAVANSAAVIEKEQSELASLRQQTQAQADYNEQIGMTPKQIAEVTAARLRDAAARKDAEAVIAEGLDLTGERAERIRAQAAELRKQANGTVAGAVKQEMFDKPLQDLNAMVDIMSALDDAAQSAAQGMAQSFGAVGQAIGGMTTALTGFERTQAAIAAQLAGSLKDAHGDPVKIQRANQMAAEASAQAQIKSYGDMASAAKGFFNENSKGYAVLQSVEKAYRAAEMVMALESMAKKILFKETEVAANTALNATKLTGEAAASAASTGLAATEASAWGVTAVVKAIASMPFPLNLAAGAATLAAVVAVGAKIVGSIGGSSVSLSEQRQKEQGAGSVFGDSDAKSESIKRALDAVEKNTYQGLVINSSMLATLRSIDSNISGFARQVVGNTDLANPNVGALNSNNGLGTNIVSGGLAAVGGMASAGLAAFTSMATIAGPLGMAAAFLVTKIPFIANIVGKIGTAIFGGKQSVEDSGFTIGKDNLASILAGGANGMSYADIKTSGGWFSKDKTSTQSSPLDPAANQQFTLILKSMADGITQAAGMLGAAGSEFDLKLSSFVVDIGKISLKGLSGEEQQKALESVFSKLGDDMAQYAIGGLAPLQQVGEGYLETLARVASEYQTVEVVFQSFGKTFGEVGISSVAARDRLVQLAGGLDKFTSAGEYFLTNFFSEQEQAAALKARIDPTLAKYGLSTDGADASKMFRDLVVGLNTTTEAGAAAYTELMTIAPAFKAVVDAQKAAQDERKDLRDQLDELTMTSAQLLAKQRDALDESNRALFDQIQPLKQRKDLQDQLDKLTMTSTQLQERERAAVDASNLALFDRIAALNAEKDGMTYALGYLDSAFSVLQNVTKRTTDDLTKRIEKEKSLASAIQSTLDSIDPPGRDEMDRQSAQAQVQAALAIAKAGGALPDADDLKKALSTLSKDASGQFGSYTDYLRDLYATKNSLAELGSIADDSLSTDQKQLDSLNSMLEAQQRQIDILKGIDNTGLSIAQALEGFKLALEGAKSNPAVAANGAISNAYQSSLGRMPDAAGLEFWQKSIASGASLSFVTDQIANSAEAQIKGLYKELFNGREADAAGLKYWLGTGASIDNIRAEMLKSDEYKRLHPFAVGTNFVPETMPALVHQGERIIPAADNRVLMSVLQRSTGGGSEALVAEVRALRETVAKQQAALDRIANNTKEHKDMFEQSTGGGGPLLVEIA